MMPCCNHFFLGQLNETQYVDEFVYNYGEQRRHPHSQLGHRQTREVDQIQLSGYERQLLREVPSGRLAFQRITH